MHKFRMTIERIDAGIYRIEKAMLLASVTGMTVLIFLQVLQRSFSREVGKSTEMLSAVVGLVSEPLPRETLVQIDPWFFWSFSVLFMFFATHAARRNRGADASAASFAVSFLGAIVLCLFFRGGVSLLHIYLPTGVPGAQKYALGLLVWAGLLGASIISRSRGHIVIDAVKKKMSDDVIGVVSFASGSVTAAFCFVLVWLAAAKTWSEYAEWVESEHLIARLYESAPLPQAMVTLALPVCFGLIGLRFFAQGLSDLLWGPPLPRVDDTETIDLDAPFDDDDAVVDKTQSTPSFIFGRPHVEGGAG